MKNATLQFDAPTIEYLRYAASIQRTTAKKFVARLTRQYEHKHPSLKRTTTLEQFISKEAEMTIMSFEREYRLPSSYTYSDRPAAAHRCWENMVANRAALSA